MDSCEYYKRYLLAIIPELETYLLSRELFWPVSVAPPEGGQVYPRLTLGGMLYAERATRAHCFRALTQMELRKIQIEIDYARAKWRTAWQAKAQREWVSRIRQWGNYLEEYRQHPDNQSSFYPVEVRWRVFVDLLMDEMEEPPGEELKLLAGLDRLVESVFEPGEFIWEPILNPEFPKQPFWYLYGSLKKSTSETT